MTKSIRPGTHSKSWRKRTWAVAVFIHLSIIVHT